MTARLLTTDRHQTVELPEGIWLPGSEVNVRREGEALILEPVKAAAWPKGFFDRILIADTEFCRPEQGPMPVPVDFGA